MSEDVQGKIPDLGPSEKQSALTRYWKYNLLTMLILLVVWAAGGLGAGILIADWLNQFQLFGSGYPLGFWFAHQGSIIIFVLLILVYCLVMNRLDARHHQEIQPSHPEE